MARLNNYQVDSTHPHFLVYRGLFLDLEQAAAHASGRLLDIGCGNKPYEKMFAGRIDEYVGCDVVQSSDRRVDVICPATKVPLEDASFNTVLCTQVLEHVADPRALLRETFRLLKSGGNLILSAPMYWPLHEEPHDFFRFTGHGLRYLLEEAGFCVKRVACNGGKWALCGQVLLHSIENSRLAHPLVIRAINKMFAYLDDRHKSYTSTINYVVVARKP
jgi:SAM-dependent methyltransferase